MPRVCVRLAPFRGRSVQSVSTPVPHDVWVSMLLALRSEKRRVGVCRQLQLLHLLSVLVRLSQWHDFSVSAVACVPCHRYLGYRC